MFLFVNCGTAVALNDGMSANLLQNIIEVTPNTAPAGPGSNSGSGSASRRREDAMDNNPYQSAPAEAANTDNSRSNAQNVPSEEQSDSFSDTLDKKIKANESQDGEVDETTKKPAEDTEKGDQAPETAPEEVDSAAQAELVRAASAKAGNLVQQAAKSMVPGEAINPTAKPVTPPIAESTKQAAVASGQAIAEIAKQMENPIQTEAAQTENKSDVSNNTLIPTVMPEKANVIGMPEAVEGEIVAGDKDLMLENGKAKSLDIATDAVKPVVADQKPAALPGQQNKQNMQESAANTPVSDAKPAIETSQPVVADKPVFADVPVKQSSQMQLPDAPVVAEGKSSQNLSNNTTGQESMPQTGGKATPQKTDATGNIDNGKTPAFEIAKEDAAPVVSAYASGVSRKSVQSQTQQPQTPVGSVSNQPLHPNMDMGEQILVGDTTQPTVVEPAPPAGAFAKVASNIDNGPNVTEQIQDSIQSSIRLDRQQVVIRLDPPELGKVTIKFVENADQITGVLHVDKAQTRDQIQRALPEIIQNLSESGVQVKKIEVVLSNQNEQYSGKEQSSNAGHDAGGNQQNSSNPDSQRNSDAYGQWTADINSSTGFIEPQMQFVDDSINMLV